MKTSFLKRAFLFSTMIFLLSGTQACKKIFPPPRPQLPPETQEGLNTFGCLVNGNVWRSGCSCLNFGPPTLDATYYRGQLWISARKADDEVKEYIDLHVKGRIISTGTYRLAAEPESYGSLEIRNNCYYETDSLNTGLLTITRLDTINMFVSGRFSFTVTKPGCETVNITDGRFDVEFN